MKNTAKARRAGFTLVELLVVIAIIAILAGVAVTQFGGSTESARATQCMNNLRNLMMGAINFATENNDGRLPAAQTHRWLNKATRPITYPSVKGWIHWNGPDDAIRTPHPYVTANTPLEQPKDDGKESKNTDYSDVVKRGALWQAMGRSRDAYKCPTCTIALQERGKSYQWHYVMNKDAGKWDNRYRSGSVSPMSMTTPDKKLIFAEMQLVTVKDASGVSFMDATAESDSRLDTVLDYATETIGFNHAQKNGRHCGHVAFADGHVAKILAPRSGNLRELTEWMCQGKEISFNGSKYEVVEQ